MIFKQKISLLAKISWKNSLKRFFREDNFANNQKFVQIKPEIISEELKLNPFAGMARDNHDVNNELKSLRSTPNLQIILKTKIDELEYFVCSLKKLKGEKIAQKNEIAIKENEIQGNLIFLANNFSFENSLSPILSIYKISIELDLLNPRIYNKICKKCVHVNSLDHIAFLQEFLDLASQSHRLIRNQSLLSQQESLESSIEHTDFIDFLDGFLYKQFSKKQFTMFEFFRLFSAILRFEKLSLSAQWAKKSKKKTELTLFKFDKQLTELLLADKSAELWTEQMHAVYLLVSIRLYGYTPVVQKTIEQIYVHSGSDQVRTTNRFVRSIYAITGCYDPQILETKILSDSQLIFHSSQDLIFLFNLLVAIKYDNPLKIKQILISLSLKKHILKLYLESDLRSAKVFHTNLEFLMLDDWFRPFLQSEFFEIICELRDSCVKNQFKLSRDVINKHFNSCLDYRSLYKQIFKHEAQSSSLINDDHSKTTKFESILFQSLFTNFPLIFKNYKSFLIFSNFPVCKYRIDVAIFIDELNLKIAVEFSGSTYQFMDGKLDCKTQMKERFLKQNGFIVVWLQHDKAFYDLSWRGKIDLIAKLSAFAIYNEVKKIKKIELDILMDN